MKNNFDKRNYSNILNSQGNPFKIRTFYSCRTSFIYIDSDTAEL